MPVVYLWQTLSGSTAGASSRIWQWCQAAFSPLDTATLLQAVFQAASRGVVVSVMALWVVNLFCPPSPNLPTSGFKRYCGAEPIPGSQTRSKGSVHYSTVLYTVHCVCIRCGEFS